MAAAPGRLLLRSHPGPQVTDGPTPDRVAFIDALRKVPAEQRRALVLYYVRDLSVAQIATGTGVPDGTVKARLARGRAALAPHLRESVGQHTSGRPAPDRPASRPVPASTHPTTGPAVSTPVPVPSGTSPSAVPTSTASGLQPVPTRSG